MLEKLAEPVGAADPLQQLNGFRLKRLLQIIAVSFVGLGAGHGGCRRQHQIRAARWLQALAAAGVVACYQKTLLAAYILLWSLVLMLSGLAYTNGGLHDIAIFGYPCVLVYAAILGSNGLFLSLLLYALAFAV